jgi:two-component system, response regulator PdtaR
VATLRVLIADENDLVSLTVSEQLQQLGHTVVGIVRNGSEAQVQLQRQRPDVLLCEVQLSGRDSLEIAAEAATLGTTVVLHSAPLSADHLNRALDHGVVAFLSKPLRIADAEPTLQLAVRCRRELSALGKENDELKEALEARKLIERAKGILMQRLHLTERDAYERLRQRARDRRAKMRDIAQAIIEAEEMLSS